MLLRWEELQRRKAECWLTESIDPYSVSQSETFLIVKEHKNISKYTIFLYVHLNFTKPNTYTYKFPNASGYVFWFEMVSALEDLFYKPCKPSFHLSYSYNKYSQVHFARNSHSLGQLCNYLCMHHSYIDRYIKFY